MGAPVGNKNASRGALIRAEIKDALERRDRRMGKLEGYSLRELFDIYVGEAFEDKDIRRDVLDRLYGKPTQMVGEDAESPIAAHVVKFVQPGG